MWRWNPSISFGARVGSDNPHDRVASETGSPFTNLEVIAISDPQVYDDGRVSANIHAIFNGKWLVNSWHFSLRNRVLGFSISRHFLSPDTSTRRGVTVVGIDIIETTDEATGAVTYAFQFLGAPTVTSERSDHPEHLEQGR